MSFPAPSPVLGRAGRRAPTAARTRFWAARATSAPAAHLTLMGMHPRHGTSPLAIRRSSWRSLTEESSLIPRTFSTRRSEWNFTGQGGGGYPVDFCDAHGTWVAGVIRAQMNNGIGGAGLAPTCRVASARVFSSLPPPCTSQAILQTVWFIDALDWAQAIGARITNHSYTISPSAALTTKFQQTHDAGLIHFACVGNNGSSVLYPANLDGIVNAVSGVSNSPSGFWSTPYFGQ